MITTLTTTDTTAYKDSYKAGMIAAGKMGTIHYESGSTMVYSLVGHAGVFKLTLGIFYSGDAWTSGATITNQLLLSSPYIVIASGMTAVLITTLDYSVVVLNNGIAPGVYTVVFTKDIGGRDLALCLGENPSTSYANSWSYDRVSREELYPAFITYGLLTDAAGFLYSTEIILKNSGNFIRTTSISKVKLLFQTMILDTHVVYGNDVVVPAGYTSDGLTGFKANFLLVGGNL